MPAWVRLTDVNDRGAPVIGNTAKTVLINGLPAALVGSTIAPHGPPPHLGSVIIQGSPTVLVENRPPAYVGAQESCLHRQITGSPNVRIPPGA